jgi:hypothetical protein
MAKQRRAKKATKSKKRAAPARRKKGAARKAKPRKSAKPKRRAAKAKAARPKRRTAKSKLPPRSAAPQAPRPMNAPGPAVTPIAARPSPFPSSVSGDFPTNSPDGKN